MEPSSKPVRNPIVVLREEFDDWAVLFHPDTAEAVGINPVGVEVWKRLDGRRSLADIVAEVRESFEEVPDNALDELSAFLDDLVKGGFVGLQD